MSPTVPDDSMPTTPTLSSIASSEISFEDLPASEACEHSAQPGDEDLKPHPTLYVQDLISIRVENTLFRIPSCYLTHDSPHFSTILEKHDMTQVLYIQDRDISSDAFSDFLRVIRTPLGVTPLSTLTEWTDVLRLSSKWGFSHLRNFSIQAIVPLASPVDKLVIARRYGFTDWIETAYVDLFEREDDLTVHEARHMAIEDVVAVAAGRREGKAQPRSTLEKIARNLLSPQRAAAASVSSGPDIVQLPLRPVTTTTKSAKPAAIQGEPRALISRWLDQIETNQNHQAVRRCLVDYINADHERVPLTLDLILHRAWGLYCTETMRYEEQEHRYGVRHSYVGPWITVLDLLHCQNRKLGLWHSRWIRDAALRLVHDWNSVLNINIKSNQWSLRSTIAQIEFLACFTASSADNKWSPISGDIFSKLWTNIRLIFEATPQPQTQLTTAKAINSLLIQAGDCMSCVEVSWEMDSFYQLIEATLSNTQDPSLHQVLEHIVKIRTFV